MNQYELRDQQELSAQDHLRWLKALWASLIIGAIFLMLPRAVPWFSSGVPETAMGRIMGKTSFQFLPFAMTTLLHILLAVGYGYILGGVIYRFEIKMAALSGTLAGLALYGLNYIIFRKVLGFPSGNEAPVVCTHLFFSLIFSVTYKGISVPDANTISETNQSA